MDVEKRADLIPSSCKQGCVVEVVAATHQGVPGFWVQHGSESRLATTGAERSPVLPDVPTIAESGFPSIVAIGWGGVMAPAGTPASAISLFNESLRKTIAGNAFDALKAGGLETLSTTPEEMAAFIDREAEKWGKLVKAGKIVAG